MEESVQEGCIQALVRKLLSRVMGLVLEGSRQVMELVLAACQQVMELGLEACQQVMELEVCLQVMVLVAWLQRNLQSPTVAAHWVPWDTEVVLRADRGSTAVERGNNLATALQLTS